MKIGIRRTIEGRCASVGCKGETMNASWTEPINTGEVPNDGSTFDVIIVGGGPAGSSAASFAAMKGYRVLLLEKAVYPRDKTCGDAVGGSSMKIVTELGVRPMIEATPLFRVDSIVFSGPGENTEVRINLPSDQVEEGTAGYSLPRLQFDYMMFKRATELVLENGGSVVQDFAVKEIHIEGEGDSQVITGVSGTVGGRKSGNDVSTFSAAVIVGAGGFNCPIAKAVTETCHDEPMRDDAHYIAAYREYWEMDVGSDIGPIEIHFLGGKLCNGYFWIFPVSGGNPEDGRPPICNVGCGLLISDMQKMDTKLRELQAWVINEHPKFVDRFANWKMVEGSGKGALIPCGSPRKNAPSYQPRRFAMTGAACVGDAASWVDPFSGEGMHQALLSGKVLANYMEGKSGEVVFTKDAAHEYQLDMWGRLGPVLTNSLNLQKLVRRKWLLNLLLKKAARDNKRGKAIRNQLELACSTKSGQEDMASAWQMVKMIFF